MIAKTPTLALLSLALCLATTTDTSAQLRRTRTISSAPTISGVSPTQISVEPGESVRFSATGRNLAGARDLKFHSGTREIFGDVVTGRIVDAGATSVSLVAT